VQILVGFWLAVIHLRANYRIFFAYNKDTKSVIKKNNKLIYLTLNFHYILTS